MPRKIEVSGWALAAGGSLFLADSPGTAQEEHVSANPRFEIRAVSRDPLDQMRKTRKRAFLAPVLARVWMVCESRANTQTVSPEPSNPHVMSVNKGSAAARP